MFMAWTIEDAIEGRRSAFATTRSQKLRASATQDRPPKLGGQSKRKQAAPCTDYEEILRTIPAAQVMDLEQPVLNPSSAVDEMHKQDDLPMRYYDDPPFLLRASTPKSLLKVFDFSKGPVLYNPAEHWLVFAPIGPIPVSPFFPEGLEVVGFFFPGQLMLVEASYTNIYEYDSEKEDRENPSSVFSGYVVNDEWATQASRPPEVPGPGYSQKGEYMWISAPALNDESGKRTSAPALSTEKRQNEAHSVLSAGALICITAAGREQQPEGTDKGLGDLWQSWLRGLGSRAPRQHTVNEQEHTQSNFRASWRWLRAVYAGDWVSEAEGRGKSGVGMERIPTELRGISASSAPLRQDLILTQSSCAPPTNAHAILENFVTDSPRIAEGTEGQAYIPRDLSILNNSSSTAIIQPPLSKSLPPTPAIASAVKDKGLMATGMVSSLRVRLDRRNTPTQKRVEARQLLTLVVTLQILHPLTLILVPRDLTRPVDFAVFTVVSGIIRSQSQRTQHGILLKPSVELKKHTFTPSIPRHGNMTIINNLFQSVAKTQYTSALDSPHFFRDRGSSAQKKWCAGKCDCDVTISALDPSGWSTGAISPVLNACVPFWQFWGIYSNSLMFAPNFGPFVNRSEFCSLSVEKKSKSSILSSALQNSPECASQFSAIPLFSKIWPLLVLNTIHQFHTVVAQRFTYFLEFVTEYEYLGKERVSGVKFEEYCLHSLYNELTGLRHVENASGIEQRVDLIGGGRSGRLLVTLVTGR
ncbi:hypothetical protein R3P38DRAFT_3344484 [Favolaschia claudopus]|uniref:Uncharacterized protein n=1 Tax=Favolaschia claudopus TaxID=2862362 RepID=A0AAW0DMU2_9AGAR